MTDLTPYTRQLSFLKKTVWYGKKIVYMNTRHSAIYLFIFPWTNLYFEDFVLAEI